MNLVSVLQSEKKLADVTGIEPVTPACKASGGIRSKSLFRLRLTRQIHQN
jgi:hypothetical protein